MANFRSALASGRILVLDGAMGTMLQARGLPAGEHPEQFCLDRPEVLRGIHADYLAAGADIILTCTFGGSRLKLPAGLEHIDKGDPADWDAMIDTNVKGLLYVTRVITPKMVAAGGGHVFNIGSIAGTEPYENGAVYCASKHAVHAISQAMRADLLASGIKVTEIRPGMVETEFSEVRFHGDKERADRVYDGVEPLTGDDIAEAIAWAAQLPAHMTVNEMVLMPSQQAGAYYTHRKN